MKDKEEEESNALSNMIIEFSQVLFLILKNLSNLPTIILERFNELFSGKCNITVNEHIPYHKIHEDGENLWSALLETGYLTKAVTEEVFGPDSDKMNLEEEQMKKKANFEEQKNQLYLLTFDINIKLFIRKFLLILKTL